MAAAVIPALHVAPDERRSLGPAQPAVREDSHQGEVELAPLSGLLGRLNAAPAATGLDGGEADDSEHVGGEGAAGLALGLG